VKRPDSETPDLDPRARPRATDLINASTDGESDGQNREKTVETLEVEATKTVEEGPTSLAAKLELEDINDIRAEEVE